VLITYRYRVKGVAAARELDRMARAVNQVWNYCGQLFNDSVRQNKPRPRYFTISQLVTGAGGLLGLHSDTVHSVTKHWTDSLAQRGRRPKWRASFGARRSLGWVPFRSAHRCVHIDGDTVTLLKRRYRLWLHRPIPDDIRSGSFSQDACGRWYLNLACAVPVDQACGTGEIGVDLGLKDFAALSDGSKIENPRHVRNSAAKLARAQRAGRKAQARKIHRKIAAQRRHFLHEHSAAMVKANRLIVVGDVSSAKLARTRMAKSVLDAGWSAFRLMLRYKAMRHGAVYVEADERYSSQTCHSCGAICGPRGIAGLSVRSWECRDCGCEHDRDTNAALNILRSGRSAALLTEIEPLAA
jgi:putative transposase